MASREAMIEDDPTRRVGDDLNDITVISVVGMAGTVCAIIFGYAGYQKGLKKDSYAMGEEQGTLKTDVSYTRRKIDDVYLEQRAMGMALSGLSDRVTRVEESTKSAHKRIDHIEAKNQEQEGVI